MKQKTKYEIIHLIWMFLFVSICSAVPDSSHVLGRVMEEYIKEEESFLRRIEITQNCLLSNSELEKIYYENPLIFDLAECPVLKMRITAISYIKKEKGLETLIFTNRESPSALTVIESFCPKHFEQRKSIWMSALVQDHQWLPAVLGFVTLNKGKLLTISSYGAIALELSDEGSGVANQVLLALLEEFNVATNNYEKIEGAVLAGIDKTTYMNDYMSYKYRLTASLFYHSGDKAQALRFYSKIYNDGFENESTYYRVAKIHKDNGEKGKALEVLQEGFLKFPESSILLMGMSEIEYFDQKYCIALKYIDKSLGLTPENPRAYILKANILTNLKRKHDAMESCINAIQFSYGWGEYYVNQIHSIVKKLNNLESQK